MRKIQILMNKPVHLGLSILDLSKTFMYEFWYNYVKPKYGQIVKLCFFNNIASSTNIDNKKNYNHNAERTNLL